MIQNIIRKILNYLTSDSEPDDVVGYCPVCKAEIQERDSVRVKKSGYTLRGYRCPETISGRYHDPTRPVGTFCRPPEDQKISRSDWLPWELDSDP